MPMQYKGDAEAGKSPFMRECHARLEAASKSEMPNDPALVMDLCIIARHVRAFMMDNEALPEDDCWQWLVEFHKLLGERGKGLAIQYPEFLVNYIFGIPPKFLAECIKNCPHKSVAFGEWNPKHGLAIMEIPTGPEVETRILGTAYTKPPH